MCLCNLSESERSLIDAINNRRIVVSLQMSQVTTAPKFTIGQVVRTGLEARHLMEITEITPDGRGGCYYYGTSFSGYKKGIVEADLIEATLADLGVWREKSPVTGFDVSIGKLRTTPLSLADMPKPYTDKVMHQLEQVALDRLKDDVHNPSKNETIQQRAAIYGDFRVQAEISQELQAVMQDRPGWARLTPYQKEALIIIAHKIARTLNGDPNYLDNWVDIIGYTQLVIDRIKQDQK